MPFTKSALGIVLLLLVAVLWVSSSFLIQYIFGEVNYDKPLFLTYISTSFFSLYLLPVCCRWVYNKHKKLGSTADINRLTEEETAVNIQKEEFSHTADSSPYQVGVLTTSPTELAISSHSTLRNYVLNILQFGLLWLTANYVFNLALDRTSVASNSILSTLSSVFTLFLASYFQIERLSWLKFGYVLLNFVGVVFVTWSDSALRGSRTLIGDCFSILSALLYSFYVLFLQVRLLHSSPLDISELFGWMGLLMMICLVPVMFLWNILGFEKFVLPSFRSSLFLIMNALIGTVLSDYLWALAVVFTSPVLATMALSLTIPLSTVVDNLQGKAFFSSTYVLGAFCVFSGFVGLAWENRKEELSRDETPNQVEESSIE
ncbi:hypothetical protein GpartN1_g7260.t1 [Galdieria partita]|uniref:EamA domain-containing protein n=1 Tax=Galdieria partita TaxID=83374 RepID=A0A9C7Q472_9RHOD|nr:hypothetical protein GpartN1_g7260.t1 [Galdieria partita]